MLSLMFPPEILASGETIRESIPPEVVTIGTGNRFYLYLAVRQKIQELWRRRKDGRTDRWRRRGECDCVLLFVHVI